MFSSYTYDVLKGSKIKCTEEDVSGTETCLETKTQMGPDKIVENSKLEKKKITVKMMVNYKDHSHS